MSTTIYVSTGENKLKVVNVDDDGNLLNIIQVIEPVDPLPPNLPEKVGMIHHSVATEWISRHPKLPILYALTSFWNEAEAVVTTYLIEDDGTLTKLGSRPTGGHQAAQASFSNDASTYAIAHHNGGKLSFFDVSQPKALDEPISILLPPELRPGTRKAPVAGSLDQGLPALHGLSYSRNGRYLVCADPVQNAVFSYEVDSKGVPMSPESPISHVVCNTSRKPYSWTQQFVAWILKADSPRPRRAVVHPNGKYLYMIHEWTNYVQIYSINEEGRIKPELLNEVSCIDPDLRKGVVGVAMSAVGEIDASDDGLIVSVRGMSLLGGRCESSVRLFAYVDDGSDLKSIGILDGITDPVRHFYRKDNEMWVGLNSSKNTLVMKYGKKGESWILKGEANVGMDVFCVTPRDI